MAKVQYKDESFYFIIIAALCCILPPLTLYRFYSWWTAKRRKSAQASASLLTKRQKRRNRMRRITTVAWWVILPLLWWVLYQVTDQVLLNPEDQTYDPFSILGITDKATKRQIRSAYRKLARVHHPDKGGSETEFVRVQKAYNALTDETARKNYQEYGHPDGPQAMSVSIGLPSFLDNDDNHVYVMLGYILAFVGLPIGSALYCLCQSPTLGGATRKALTRNLLKDFKPGEDEAEGVLSALRSFPSTAEELVVLMSYTKEMQESLPSPLPPHSALEDMHQAIKESGHNLCTLSPAGSEGYERSVCEVMMWFHLTRNLDGVKETAVEHTQWVEASVELQDHEGAFETILKFILGQAVDYNTLDFVSLLITMLQSHRTGLAAPPVEEDMVSSKKTKRGKKKGKKKKNLKSKKPKETKTDDTQDKCVQVSVDFETKGEKYTAAGDLVTATIKLTIAGDAPPAVRDAGWSITLGTPSRGRRIPGILKGITTIAAEEVDGSDEIERVVQVPFQAPHEIGWVKFNVTATCLGYAGVDRVVMKAINIKDTPDDEDE